MHRSSVEEAINSQVWNLQQRHFLVLHAAVPSNDLPGEDDLNLTDSGGMYDAIATDMNCLMQLMYRWTSSSACSSLCNTQPIWY